jgi:hypothetical protein
MKEKAYLQAKEDILALINEKIGDLNVKGRDEKLHTTERCMHRIHVEWLEDLYKQIVNQIK